MDHQQQTGNDGKKRELSRRSDQILSAIEDLHELESRKRRKPISTPEFHELAQEVEDRSRAIFRMAGDEDQVGEEIETDGDAIEDVAPRRA